jgi:hypothetical protein
VADIADVAGESSGSAFLFLRKSDRTTPMPMNTELIRKIRL